MAVREISQIDITRDLNRSLSQLQIPATSTNWKLDAKWHWIDNSVIAIAPGSWRTVGLPAGCISQLNAKQKPTVNFMIFIRRLLLLGASWAASFVSGLCWWKTAPNNYTCRRPVGQRGYSHKALSLIREWRPLNRERRRSALSLGGTGYGAALTQTILGQTLPVMILQNAVIDNAKKAVISHRK